MKLWRPSRYTPDCTLSDDDHNRNHDQENNGLDELLLTFTLPSGCWPFLETTASNIHRLPREIVESFWYSHEHYDLHHHSSVDALAVQPLIQSYDSASTCHRLHDMRLWFESIKEEVTTEDLDSVSSLAKQFMKHGLRHSKQIYWKSQEDCESEILDALNPPLGPFSLIKIKCVQGTRDIVVGIIIPSEALAWNTNAVMNNLKYMTKHIEWAYGISNDDFNYIHMATALIHACIRRMVDEFWLSLELVHQSHLFDSIIVTSPSSDPKTPFTSNPLKLNQATLIYKKHARLSVLMKTKRINMIWFWYFFQIEKYVRAIFNVIIMPLYNIKLVDKYWPEFCAPIFHHWTEEEYRDLNNIKPPSPGHSPRSHLTVNTPST